MIKPLSNNILIKMSTKDEDEKTTKSGIILGNKSKDKSQIGEVIATGKGKKEDGKIIPPEIKVGDKVIIPEYGGTKVKYNDLDYVIISEDSILAIVE